MWVHGMVHNMLLTYIHMYVHMHVAHTFGDTHIHTSRSPRWSATLSEAKVIKPSLDMTSKNPSRALNISSDKDPMPFTSTTG